MSYELSDRVFKTISTMIYDQTGIALRDHKRSMIVARLSKRIRALGLGGFDAYLNYVNNSASGAVELTEMINSITTNKTDFFREPHHFDYLNELLPRLYEEGEKTGRRKLKIWSSASSTGEEPYSIAMVVSEFFERVRGWDVQILASDVDTNALTTASKGAYRPDILTPIPLAFRNKYFMKDPSLPKGHLKVKPRLREMILFRQINLINDEFRFKDPLDIIFCRNVVIYFDDPTKEKLVEKFYRVLRPDAHIFVGHSESLLLAKKEFKFLKNTIYQRT